MPKHKNSKQELLNKLHTLNDFYSKACAKIDMLPIEFEAMITKWPNGETK